MTASLAERRAKAARALAQGLQLSEAEAEARLARPPAPPPPTLPSQRGRVDDGCNEFERKLCSFLVRAYTELDHRLSIGNSILHQYLKECLDWAVGYREWRQRNPFECGWPTAPDLEAEYRQALALTTTEDLQPLRQAGVTDWALEISRPALATVQMQQGGLFEFWPDGNASGYIVPIRTEELDSPEAENPIQTTAQGQIVDLVLFTPAANARTALRYGAADWLGNCPRQEAGAAPVRVHRRPIDWLRADCEGLVCLATEPAEMCRALSRFQAIAVDQKQADQIGNIFSLPVGRPTLRIVQGGGR